MFGRCGGPMHFGPGPGMCGPHGFGPRPGMCEPGHGFGPHGFGHEGFRGFHPGEHFGRFHHPC